MPYGSAFYRKDQTKGGGGKDRNDSFDNCFSGVDSGPLHKDDSSWNANAYQSAKSSTVTNNMFYNPFSSFGTK